MNYQLEKMEGKVKFTFEILPAEWEEEVNNVYLKTKSRFNVPGFRRGHASRKMIENIYGQGVFFDDAVNNIVKKGYSKALSENDDVYPVDEPKVDIESFDDKGIKFSLEVTVKPTVKLGAYTGINLEKVEYTVMQSDVDDAIERDRRAHKRINDIKDRPVKDGDKVLIDFSGKVDGVKFDGGTAENQTLVIGSKTFIPGFEEQLIGMNIDETRDITVKFPSDYHAENLAGKDAVFTVTVHSITEEIIPEADDGFAQEMGPYEKFDEYKKDVKAKLEESNKRRERIANENNIIEAVVNNAEFTVPECMVNTQLDYELDNLAQNLAQSNFKLEDYFKYIGSSVEEFRQERRNDALTTVKTRLVIEQLAKELDQSGKIKVTDEEVDAKIDEYVKAGPQNGNALTAEDIKQSGQTELFRNSIVMDKTIEFLMQNNTFTKEAKKEKSTKESDKKEPAKKNTAKKETVKKETADKAEKSETKDGAESSAETTARKTTKRSAKKTQE